MCRKLYTRWIINLVCYGCVLAAQGQVIKPGWFIDQRFPVFNAHEISEHNIERISITLFDKPSLKPMVDEGNRVIYEFDTLGKLTRFMHVFTRLSGKADTMSREFHYLGSELASETEVLGRYRRKVTYHRQSPRVTHQTIEVKRGAQEWQTLDMEQIVRDTSIRDMGTEVIESTGGLNSKPYQRIVRLFDEEDRPLHRQVWNGPRSQLSEYWSYEGEHLVAYRSGQANSSDSIYITYKVEDDRHDSGTWCTGSACSNWSMVYASSGLPKGWIFIDPETQDMKVWEFEYRFFQPADESMPNATDL